MLSILTYLLYYRQRFSPRRPEIGDPEGFTLAFLEQVTRRIKLCSPPWLRWM
jgi:hypothetical protein